MTITKTIIIDVEADQATKELEKFDDTIKETDDSTEDLTGSLDAMTGGAIGGFTKMLGGVKKVIVGFKSMKVAIAATGIGLLLIAIVALKAAFTGSEEGQNTFSKLMLQIGVVTGNVIDIFATLGESLFAIGKALVRLAKGDIEGAKNAWGEFKDKVNEATDSIRNFGKETAREVAEAGKVADLRAKADKIDRKLLVERAKLESSIADLRLKARESDKFTALEREQFLKDSEILADSLLKKEQEALQLRFDAQKLENTFSRSNKENLDKEAAAEAALFNVQTRRLTEQKAVIRELDRVRNELAANEKARLSEIAAAEKEQQDILSQIAKDKESEDKERIKKEEELIDAEIEREQEKQDALLAIDIAASQARIEQSKKERDEKIQLDLDVKNAKIQIANVTFGLIQSLAKEGSALAKGAAIAQTLFNTFTGVMGAFSTPIPTPFAVKLANAVTVGAMGVLNLKRIASTNENSSGSSDTSVRRGASPSFNLVQGTGTNQIAQGLNQEVPIVKAFVVSSDVTTAQSLDRNILEGASL